VCPPACRAWLSIFEIRSSTLRNVDRLCALVTAMPSTSAQMHAFEILHRDLEGAVDPHHDIGAAAAHALRRRRTSLRAESFSDAGTLS